MSNRYRKGSEIDQQIVAAADRLFQERGFENTSFQDLADASGVPKGNFYHYYRSKDDVLDAVIARRMSVLDALIAQVEERTRDPLKRILDLASALMNGPSKPLLYGCPYGSLCLELTKGRPDLLDKAAEPLARLRRWLAAQFRAGAIPGNCDQFALELMARIQGVVLICAAFRDEAFAGREIKATHRWLAALRTAPSAAKSDTRRKQ
jgi:TetR/AcrR family transcriptional regulator, transcriptional repressor for nem operon